MNDPNIIFIVHRILELFTEHLFLCTLKSLILVKESNLASRLPFEKRKILEVTIFSRHKPIASPVPVILFQVIFSITVYKKHQTGQQLKDKITMQSKLVQKLQTMKS